MTQQLILMLQRLKRPSVLLSLASQVVTIMLLLGFNVNQDKVMTLVSIACSILVSLGVLSNPDTKTAGYGDDILPCSADGKMSSHVRIGDDLYCANCGAKYTPELPPADDADLV